MTESTKTAIITAVLTGIFTVVAGVATYWFTTKEPELSYSVVGGPALSNASGSKRIFVVEVRNDGKKEVAQTLIQVSLKFGELSEAASEASPGVKLAEEKTQHQIDIRADLLNPGDAVKVSFLTALASQNGQPTVVVRAPGVKAIAESSKSNNPLDIALLPLILGTLAAVLSTFLMAARIGFLGRLVGFAGPSLDQSEISANICAACGLHDEANRLRFGGPEISYRGTADFLLQQALSVEEPRRKKYDMALRGLLLFADTTPNTQYTIRYAIEFLAGSPISDADFEELKNKKTREGEDPVVWRQRLVTFVSEANSEN
ncbi:hypothetical protein G4G28_20135 [Massilia sp. Dwa41.01b]|uniref:hypothetical protein n=1 Tax=unclassified Massilia TaxID=2609279 RepID=UPI001600D948|nr:MULTISPECIES: hypothetical protein [unclassified Massilia]QNA90230.1 hypothetical protein G4G28_20135 [Massilia sp. Dwa41.01b]QNB01123.1 hypothetical protein G4G31_23745 [Massilia sp. Se16.2.3]